MIVVDYMYWHYRVAPVQISGLLRNYLIATWHRFMIGTHARTLLSPWHRAKPSDVGSAQTLGDKAGNTLVDFYIRMIAAIIRLIIILIGLIAELILVIAFMALLIIWLLWPVILFLLLLKGSSLIFSKPYTPGYGIKF